MNWSNERALLQVCILLAGLVPVMAGFSGMLHGAALFDRAVDVDLDNHFRYLSGLLAGLGISFWWMIPTIEQRTHAVRVLTGMVVLGGFARLGAMYFSGIPSFPMQLALGMELVITPLLCLWQGRVARLAPPAA